MAMMGTTAPVRSSERNARHAGPGEEEEEEAASSAAAGPHCFSSHRTLSRNAPRSAAAPLPGKSRSGYTRPTGAEAGLLAGAEADDEEEEAEEEEEEASSCGGFSDGGGGGGGREAASRLSARMDGIARLPIPLSLSLSCEWGFRVLDLWFSAAGVFP